MDKTVMQMVVNYYNNDLKTERKITDLDVYIVWKCKTLQNWKYMLSTNMPDTRYFEITYNGDKDEFYFDSYVKECNKCIK